MAVSDSAIRYNFTKQSLISNPFVYCLLCTCMYERANSIKNTQTCKFAFQHINIIAFASPIVIYVNKLILSWNRFFYELAATITQKVQMGITYFLI